ncbi:NACHT, LRR and PYD domains-containing protein 3-like [Protopterus annectens]|uniref:NACHT, LRR and PYD domains-containing protein 3-like n=1 Tax=Protopterus annectens TaxID=7888 RepID=UPI001CFB48A7|nr:NACHT, LRR and PYD domains-containing protein 3-like [Protopterus annectens]
MYQMKISNPYFVLTAADIIPEIKIINNGQKLEDNLKSYQHNYKDSILAQTRKMGKKMLPGGRQQEEELLVEHYTELRVVTNYQHTEGQIQHEMLVKGQEHEKLMKDSYRNKCERITPSQLFRICSESMTFPRVVLVSGVPGIGKTTMVQKMLYDWIQGDQYKQFSFVFLFKFRDMNLWEEPLNLPEMILKQHSCLRDVIEQILGRPSTVLFMFDGLDESKSPLDFTVNQICSDLRKRTSHVNVVSSLMKQTLMKGCSVIITSRPSALDQMDWSCIHRCTEIMGFLDEDRLKYFKKQFSDSNGALEAFEYVRQNDILYTMCFNPSYCWIICSVLKQHFTGSQNESSSCPKTLTQLFVCFLNNILTNHTLPGSMDLKGLLCKVSHLAFKGVCNKLLVFTDTDLKQQKIECTQARSSFLLEFLVQEESFQRTMYTFLHLTVQECLGALWYFLGSEQNILDILKSEQNQDGRLEILIRFLAGLSHPPTSYPLQKILGPFPVEKQVEILKWLKGLAEYSIKHLAQDSWSEKDKNLDPLKVFHYLFESQNVELIRETVGTLKCFTLENQTLNPVDCYVLNYIIVTSGGITELQLDKTQIPMDGICKLKEAFCLCTSISLKFNNIGDEGAKYLSKAVQSPNSKIQKLE